MRDATWFDLSPGHGVLELHERVTAPGPALELHVIEVRDGSHVRACWLSDDGRLLRWVQPGRA